MRIIRSGVGVLAAVLIPVGCSSAGRGSSGAGGTTGVGGTPSSSGGDCESCHWVVENFPTGGVAGGGGSPGAGGQVSSDPRWPPSFAQNRVVIDLGVVSLANPSTATLTLSNDGDVGDKVIITPGAGVATQGCGAAIWAGSSCELTVTLTPPKIGAFVGELTVEFASYRNETLRAFFLARVTSQRFTVSPDKLPFGLLPAGAAATAQRITVTATDNVAGLTITPVGKGVSINPSATTCTATLARGDSCVAVVDYAALSAGIADARVDFRADGGGSDVLSVPILAKTSTATKLTTDPQAVEVFAAQEGEPSSAVPIDVLIPGDDRQTAIAAGLTGPNSSDFIISSSNCPDSAKSGTCTLSLVFAPSLVTASTTRTATLNVTAWSGDASNGTASVPLFGTLYAKTSLAISPSGSDMGAVSVGETGIDTHFTVVTADGVPSGALAVSLAGGDFTLVRDDCTGQGLNGGYGGAPGGSSRSSCVLSVALKPASVGRKQALLLVKGTSAAPAVKTLTGTGLATGDLLVNPAIVDFGGQARGGISEGKTIIIQNLGSVSTGALEVRYSSPDPNSVYVTASTCAAPLAPGAACALTVHFVDIYGVAITRQVIVTDGETDWTTTVTAYIR